MESWQPLVPLWESGGDLENAQALEVDGPEFES